MPAALGACAPDLGKAPTPRTAASLASSVSLPDENGRWPGDGWWRAYGDPQLDALIQEGLKGAPDIAAAAARLARAEGEAEVAGAAGGPSATANGSIGKAKQSYNFGIPPAFVPRGWQSVGNLNLQLALDLDIWGRNRALHRAALDEAQAARLDAAEARLTLAAAIASAYADLARLYAERDVADQAVRIQTETSDLVSQRVNNGLDTQGELRQAAAAVPAARVDLATIDESILMVRHQIAALIGAGPDRGLAISRPQLGMLHPAALPADAGIALVGRRPDIVAARMRAEAAAQRIHAARAAFYPNLSLSGLIGMESLGLSKLLETGSSYGNAGPALSLPLFDMGQRAGSYRVARADYDAAVADYDRTLVGALREVADAVSGRAALAGEVRDAQASLADSEAAFRIARLRYQGGLSTYLSVLTAEQAVIAARRRNVDLAARGVTLDIALVRALGGGFAGE